MASPGGTRTGGAVRDRPMADGGTTGRGTATRRSLRRRRGGGHGWYLIAGTLVSAVFVVPLGWEVIRSLQPESAVIAAPSSASFSHLGIANYQALLSGSDDERRLPLLDDRRPVEAHAGAQRVAVVDRRLDVSAQ